MLAQIRLTSKLSQWEVVTAPVCMCWQTVLKWPQTVSVTWAALSQLKATRLGDLPAYCLTGALLHSLHSCFGLELLGLGDPDTDIPPETASQR